MRQIFARFTDDVVRQIEGFADQLDSFVTEAIAAPSDGPPRVVQVTLTITLPTSVSAEFQAECDRLSSEVAVRAGIDW